jgi:hypothetical protein
VKLTMFVFTMLSSSVLCDSIEGVYYTMWADGLLRLPDLMLSVLTKVDLFAQLHGVSSNDVLLSVGNV